MRHIRPRLMARLVQVLDNHPKWSKCDLDENSVQPIAKNLRTPTEALWKKAGGKKPTLIEAIMVAIIFINKHSEKEKRIDISKGALDKYLVKTSGGTWRYKPKEKRKSEHNSIVQKIALIGKMAGLKVYADLVGWKKNIELSVPKNTLDRLVNIDVLWYSENGITHEFEIEDTTGISNAIIRGSNIPGKQVKRYIVIPKEREKYLQKKIGEPILRKAVSEYKWQVIYYESLSDFLEKNKQISVNNFEKLGQSIQ